MKALWIAFSMYSRIPTPQFLWEERDRRRAMYFFPLVGAAVGICFMAVFLLMRYIGAGRMIFGAVLTAVPLFVTGGIHMDGFLDTCDARASFTDREKRLAILKDTHAGAFAVLSGALYLLIYFAACVEMADWGYPGGNGLKAMAFDGRSMTGGVPWGAVSAVSAGFILSRSLSGLAVAVLPEARKQGMLADFMKDVDQRRLAVFMLGCVLASAMLIGACGGWCGLLAAGTALVVFLLFCRMALREFGGITGDLAGYFLQCCELFFLLAVLFGIYILD